MSDRISKLLAQLTLDEKVSLCAGADMWSTPGVPRLGIPPLVVSDGPSGARGPFVPGAADPSTCFPCGSSLGATFDPALVRRIGEALAVEADDKGAQVLLAPTVNLHRSPLAGRNFECFSEDPRLSARLAAAYVAGVQSGGVAACVKHFVCNDSEFERHTISSEVGPRALRELYLVPFEAAVREAKAWSLMGAYNRVNGTYACEHPALLRDLLVGEWGFDGAVISDWYATQSCTAAANAGLDLEMPGPPRRFGADLRKAVESGEVPEARLDEMVLRLLRLRERTGALDALPAAPRSIDRPAHRALAREAGAASIVLLQNENELLPFDAARLRSLAVIGPCAEPSTAQGGGSCNVTPHHLVSALAGLRARCGDAIAVRYERGCGMARGIAPIGAAQLAPGAGGVGPLTVELFRDGDLAGEPAHATNARRAEIAWFGEPAPGVDPAHYSARVTGTLVPTESGAHTLALASVGRSRLRIDGRIVVDNWDPRLGGEHFFGTASKEVRGVVTLEAGRRYALAVEYEKLSRALPLAGVRVGLLLPDPPDLLERAVACAAAADAAVVVVGLDSDWETEGRDRESWALPGRQAELVERVAAANPHTVVVVNAGSPVAMEWAPRVPAVLLLGYPGQELGHALADVLFGDADPGGRLPTSLPLRFEDHPAFHNYPGESGRVLYGEGILVGYRHYDTARVPVRFPFGHGLGFARFELANLTTSATSYAPGEPIEASLDVTNTSAREGTEVVQLYLHDPVSKLRRPEQELVAFEKVRLAPGERRRVRFALDARALSAYDPEKRAFVAEPGEFELRAGRSSRDLRARARFTLREA
ncbi:MAG TPA: glycoside hydrolase family 3 C-terminal domain-containing protein [Myxococcota bacterium]|nr:glycoside hydrolase family 3 C-terminal domain-containing protein [Myxococcota bacterium]